MKNKKNISKIIALLMVLVVCVGALVVWVQYTVNQNVVSCYYAKTNVEPYTTIDNSNFMEFFEEGTIHKTSYEKLKNPVTSKDQIIGYETNSKIISGYPLDASLFQKKTNSTYLGIKEPAKVTLPIESEKVDKNILTKGQIVTIVGYMNSTASVTDSEGNTVENDAWIGILTNNAIVYSVTTDKNGVIESTTFIIEKTVYPTIVMMSENYALYFLEGSLENIADSKSEIVKNLYDKSGTSASQTFSVTNTSLNFDIQRVESNIPTYFATGTDLNYSDAFETADKKIQGVKQKLSYFYLNETNGLDLTWTGSTASVFVYHYSVDGTRGDRYGLYSKISNGVGEDNKEKYSLVYNPLTSETSFSLPLASVGFYQVIFDIKNPKYGQTYNNSAGIEVEEPYYVHYAINFVVLNNSSDYRSNYKLTIDTLNSNKLVYDLDSTIDWFENIELMKNYSETKKLENIVSKELQYIGNDGQTYYIPLFNSKNTVANPEGLTATNEQKQALIDLFGAEILTEEIYNKVFTIKDGSNNVNKYTKEELQKIIDVLTEVNDGKFIDYTYEQKYIVLYSLGYDFSSDTTTVSEIIANILKPKTEEDGSIYYANYVLTDKDNKYISITIEINE